MSIDLYRSSATEAQLLAAVQEKIAGLRGQSIHIRRGQRQDVTGWPDVVGVVPIGGDPSGPHLLIAVEIKTASDRRNPKQDEWLRRLGLVSASVATVLRAGRPKFPDELGLDDVHAMIEQGAIR